MTKWLAVAACFMCAIQCFARAIGDATSHPIPDEYRWVWFVVTLGWVWITYRSAVELQMIHEGRRNS